MAYCRSSCLYRVIDIQIDNRLIVKTKFSLKIKQNHQNDTQTIMYFFVKTNRHRYIYIYIFIYIYKRCVENIQQAGRIQIG